MAQKYIVGDVVMYDNKIMVVKEPRDGRHFELSCPNEGLVYDLVDIEEIKPVRLTPEILEKNGWEIVSCRDGEEIYTRGGTCRFTRLININSFYLDGARYNTTGQWLIKYVHELQHHLWALGMNNNIKI